MLSKKVLQFILLTFFISWSVALATYLLDIKYGSILSLVVIAILYMPAPAYAVLILQKLVYRGKLMPYGFTLEYVSQYGNDQECAEDDEPYKADSGYQEPP